MKLHQISPLKMLREQKFEIFANPHQEYSQFQLDMMKGSRGLHGSSMSEQNHSSILCTLNDGHTKNNTYCEEPMTLFKDLMECNRVHSICMNKVLADADNAMVGVIEELKNSKQSDRTIDLLKAANQLCRPKYERYKEKRKRSNERLSIQRDESGIVTVSDITNSLSKS